MGKRVRLEDRRDQEQIGRPNLQLAGQLEEAQPWLARHPPLWR